MKNLISIVEIPTIDFSRAVKFYQAILDISIEEIDMQGTQMGVFPSDGEVVSVVLIKSEEYKPTVDGTNVYLNAGDDLQTVLDKIKPNGGKVALPKTEISAEIGFFAMFIDTEGNKLGLHSKNQGKRKKRDRATAVLRQAGEVPRLTLFAYIGL
jgi:predicted enzyme related to lactoylglutathione lyase